MQPRTFELAAKGIRLVLDLDIGHIAALSVEREGRACAPFHRAPWADDATPPGGTGDAPHLARISGDFFCAPFSTSDVEKAPAHGWSANSAWRAVSVHSAGGGVRARFELERSILGARLVKELTLSDGHPFVYQRHIFTGGTGALPVANHAMVRLPSGGRMAFSAKRYAETPDTPLEADPERGRSALAYPARSKDLAAFPAAGGDPVDLTSYPIASDHEDFVTLVEAADSALGWSAVSRPVEGDVALMLKNPDRLPVTMLWFSNGGRIYAPWNGRHRDVLGVEDGCTYSGHGHAASTAANPMSDAGIPTAIRLDPAGTVDVRHVIGAAPPPEGFGHVVDLECGSGKLRIVDGEGHVLTLPFNTEFLPGEA